MAGFDYISAQKTSDRLIKQFGFALPILKSTSTFDPVLGKNTITSIQVSTNFAVSLPATSASVSGYDNSFREEVKKGKIRFLYISAKELSFDLEAGDLVIFENKIWHIAGATPLNPAGIPLYFTVGIKSGGMELEKVLDDLGVIEQLTLIQSLDDMIVVGGTSQTFRDYLYDIITKFNGNIFA